ncbi:MAG: 50S ribosomal protein L6 [Bdellovibrionaceae bacterium]|nr:50S ribosomal protein L6 [Pseudobdellovibrionaceae bacterium]
MSRIGKVPIKLDKAKVQVSVLEDNTVTIKGAKSTLNVWVNPLIKVDVSDTEVILQRSNEEAKTRAFHGLYRTLVSNAIAGVSDGFSKTLILNGVGYKSAVKGQNLELHLGYSHPIVFAIPKGIEIAVKKQTTIEVKGADKQLVGQVAANIRGYRKPEPFLGKGIRYSDEVIRRKAGKAAGK